MVYFIPLYLVLREAFTLKVIFFDIIFPNFIELLSTSGLYFLKISGLALIIYSLFSASLLVISWIGIIKLKDWGRKVLIIYCWFQIFNGFWNIVTNIFSASTISLDTHMMRNIQSGTGIVIVSLIIYYFSRSKIKNIFTSTEAKIYYFR